MDHVKAKVWLLTNVSGRNIQVAAENRFRSLRTPGPILAGNTELAHMPARIKLLPVLVVEDIFASTPADISDAVVEILGDRFLVSGYYHKTAPINGGIKQFSNVSWRGELSVVTLGKVISYLAYTKPAFAHTAAKR
jgi:hypothetical protein